MRLRRPPNLVLNSVLGVLVVAGAVWAYQLVTVTSGSSAPTGELTRTVAVSQGEVVATVSASGSVQSAVTAAAEFTTSGTVTSIAIKVGDTVQQGAVLAQLDPTQAQAELDAAEANLSAAYRSLDRAEDGGDEAAIASAEAAVATAESAVTVAEQALAGTVLTAPISGTVTAVNGSVGASASGSGSSGPTGNSSTSSSTGFVELADLTSMQVTANFAEADATKLQVGQTANVTWAALSGTTASATVSTIAPTATTSNNVNSYAVAATLDELPASVRIGQTVTIVVTVAQTTDAIRVPAAAVTAAGNRHTVTVATGDGGTEVRAVEIGIEGDTFTEITSGLAVGDQVVIVTATNDDSGFPGGGLPGGGFPGGGGGFPGGGGGFGGGPGGGGPGGGGGQP